MLTEGADLSQFQKNPVLFYLHDDWSLPIGRWENIRKEGSKILADAVFDMDDEQAVKIANKVEKDFLRMASIGAWPPIELSEDPALILKGQKYPTVTKWLVREASIVPIGANHNAVRLFDEEGTEVKDFDEIVKLMDNKTKANTKSNSNNMKEVAKALKLSDSASESEVLSKVNELLSTNVALSSEKEALETEKTALEAKVVLLADAEKARKSAEAISLVDTAIKDGRINADSKDKMISLFDKDHESAKAVLESMPKRKTIADKVIENTDKRDDEDRTNWTYSDWAEKDPKGLKNMKLSDPEGFKTLQDEFRKKFSI